MAKPNPLSKAMQNKPKTKAPAAEKAAPGPVAVPPANGSPARPPSREGRIMIGAHFLPEVQRELKIIAATEGTTLQALFAEAINIIFAKRNRPEIATVATVDGRRRAEA